MDAPRACGSLACRAGVTSPGTIWSGLVRAAGGACSRAISDVQVFGGRWPSCRAWQARSGSAICVQQADPASVMPTSTARRLSAGRSRRDQAALLQLVEHAGDVRRRETSRSARASVGTARVRPGSSRSTLYCCGVRSKPANSSSSRRAAGRRSATGEERLLLRRIEPAGAGFGAEAGHEGHISCRDDSCPDNYLGRA